eukprot:SAG31_NODE_72_length_27821_cov_26.870572_7_plen_604_part_00
MVANFDLRPRSAMMPAPRRPRAAAMTSLVLSVCGPAVLGAVAAPGLQMTVWNNGAWGGEGAAQIVSGIDNATFAFASDAEVFSAELRGTFTPPLDAVRAGRRLELSCIFVNGNGYLWLDDHVICEGGHDRTQWGAYQSDAKILPWMVAPGEPLGQLGGPLFLRATFAHPKPTGGPPPFVVFRWTSLPPLPPPAPPLPPPTQAPTFVGCYIDSTNGKRDLAYNAGDLKTSGNPDGPRECRAECASKGHALKYIGLQDGTNCFCGDTMGSQGKAPDSECNMTCPGQNNATMCGGTCRNSIYLTHNPLAPPPPTPPPPTPIPASTFTTAVPHAQEKRLEMQRGLLHGRWGTFAKGSYAAHALLPHGVLIKFGVCDSDGSCTEEASKNMQNNDLVRVGAHAYDHSYTQLYMNSTNHCNVSIETSQLDGKAGGDLVTLITPISGCKGASALAMMMMTTSLTADCAAWLRYGTVAKTPAGIRATPVGTGLDSVQCSADGAAFSGKASPKTCGFGGAPKLGQGCEYLLRDLSGPVAFSTGHNRTVAEVTAIIASARSKELATYAKYGDLADAKQMSQVGMMWNVLYSLEIAGTFAPVSRGWGRPWVIFDW